MKQCNKRAESKNYFALWHFGNCYLALKTPQIFTRQAWTSDEVIWTLSCKYCTQEVLKKYFKVPKIEENNIFTYQYIYISSVEKVTTEILVGLEVP